jgi:SAM-dependent methyltransferase
MVTTVTPVELEAYLRGGDPVLELLEAHARDDDASATSHRWLVESPAKRMLYWRLYGDLLTERRGLSVLDVGGGYSSLTRLLAERHDYTVLELFAHEDADRMAALDVELGGFWLRGDWYRAAIEREFDMIVANDLFPNVDQRLVPFLDRYLARCRELRLSLTYFNAPRFYETRRVDADEILFVVPWDGEQLARSLEPYAGRAMPDLGAPAESLFANERHVAVAVLPGGDGAQAGLRALQ